MEASGNVNEIWKDIEGYEGHYQISNLGRVRSIPRSGSGRNTKEGVIKKQNLNQKGYYIVSLCKNMKHKSFLVHRLVAQAFIENPNNYPIINHKDENPLNNNVENLEWCTRLYNNIYGNRMNKYIKKRGIKVNQYDLDGNFIKSWKSCSEASRQLGISNHINKVCERKRKTCGGFKWKYVESE